MDAVDLALWCAIVGGAGAAFLVTALLVAAAALLAGKAPPEGWRDVTLTTAALSATGSLLAIAILQVDSARAARELFG